jgi:adenylate cyclase
MAASTDHHPHADLLERLHLMGGAGVLGFVLLFASIDHHVAAGIEAAFLVTLAVTWTWLRLTGRNVMGIAAFHIVALLFVVAALSWSLGGLMPSGCLMFWGILSPLSGMMFLGRRGFVVTSAIYLALILVLGQLDPSGPWVQPVSASLVGPLTATNLIGGSLLALAILYYFHEKLQLEQKRADNLLLNMLPAEIAQTLKHQPGTIAQQHDGASILFADIVGFTPMCRELTPSQVVELLNEVFSRFDALAAHYGVEKIKTIGDCYMVAAGVPREDPRHAELLTAMAMEMVELAQLTIVGDQPLKVRVGISSGPVVAGVIGQRKFIYDLWGDAVNLASRMESHGATNQVRVTASTRALIRDSFVCTSLGTQPIKGVGEIEVWQVDGWRGGVEPLPTFRDEQRAAG